MEIFPHSQSETTDERDSKEITLAVSDPIVQDSTLFKFTVYKVKGEDGYGPIDCSRRYKDFLALREALQKMWPGVIVPSLPPKKAIVLFST